VAQSKLIDHLVEQIRAKDEVILRQGRRAGAY